MKEREKKEEKKKKKNKKQRVFQKKKTIQIQATIYEKRQKTKISST